MLCNRSDAEDVMQEVFIKLQDRLGSFKGNSSIKTFIYRMTVNQCIDFIRSRQSQANRAERSTEGISLITSRSPDSTMILDNLLKDLPDDHRAALVLFEITGFSLKEIALIMDTNINTIKSRISRSIKKISETSRKEA
jgi:RNA polymerase sigma-70 factor (ECF subfamily)